MSMTQEIKNLLKDGAFIPAHPLALNKDKSLDEESQRMLTHYYIDSGVDGIAVGVHTTQFEIRDREFNLYETVLRIASEEIEKRKIDRSFIKIAGICGETPQALSEIDIAIKYGYHMALVSLGGMSDKTESELLDHVRILAQKIPVFGFYLQPSAGGRIFSFEFWREFMNIEGVCAVKAAPFNRYQTHDIMRAICLSDRIDDIAVYTGNDDNIIADLLTPYTCVNKQGDLVEKHFSGGLLGHWSVWTHSAVKYFKEIKIAQKTGLDYSKLLKLGTQITDANSAFFDQRNQFQGSISGINEVLARSGLMQSNLCLAEREVLSQGQREDIDRVHAAYPDLTDDSFIKDHLDYWRMISKK